MGKPGRKVGYRSPNSRKILPVLEQLYLMGYTSTQAHALLLEQGLHCSTQTTHRFWQEIKAKHPQAVMQYGRWVKRVNKGKG